jgi:DUF4097 and DUF4098 domain-containing protein YvlB
MKFYRIHFAIILILSSSCHLHASWSKWMDTLTTKFNMAYDVIVHKEFQKAKQLELHNITGSILIKSWKQNSIAVEIISSGSPSFQKNIKIDSEQIDDLVKIHSIFMDEKIKGTVIFNILLPENIDLAIFTQQGDIIIKDLYGSMNIQTLKGSINLHNPHANIDAKTYDGNIIIHTDFIDHAKIFNLESGKGDIEIITTPLLQTYFEASAPQGKVLSQIPITLESKTTLLNADAWKNFRQSAQGVIGKPQAKLTCIAHNGSILITSHTP